MPATFLRPATSNKSFSLYQRGFAFDTSLAHTTTMSLESSSLIDGQIGDGMLAKGVGGADGSKVPKGILRATTYERRNPCTEDDSPSNPEVKTPPRSPPRTYFRDESSKISYHTRSYHTEEIDVDLMHTVESMFAVPDWVGCTDLTEDGERFSDIDVDSKGDETDDEEQEQFEDEDEIHGFWPDCEMCGGGGNKQVKVTSEEQEKIVGDHKVETTSASDHPAIGISQRDLDSGDINDNDEMPSKSTLWKWGRRRTEPEIMEAEVEVQLVEAEIKSEASNLSETQTEDADLETLTLGSTLTEEESERDAARERSLKKPDNEDSQNGNLHRETTDKTSPSKTNLDPVWSSKVRTPSENERKVADIRKRGPVMADSVSTRPGDDIDDEYDDMDNGRSCVDSELKLNLVAILENACQVPDCGADLLPDKDGVGSSETFQAGVGDDWPIGDEDDDERRRRRRR